MEAFLTGSRAYGKPTVKSDTDLVVRMSPELKARLLRLSQASEADTKAGVIRFGELNIIPALTDAEMAVWKVGTDKMIRMKLKDKKPIDRKRAIKILDKLRAATNVNIEAPSDR